LLSLSKQIPITMALWAGLPVLLAATPAVAQVPTDATVAVLSSQRISSQSIEGRAGQERLQGLQRQRASELRQKQQALEETRRLIADSGATKELKQLESKQRADLDLATVQAQTEFQTTQRDVTLALQAKVRIVLEELLKGTSVQVVLQSEGNIIWTAPGVDLTDAVIARLNARVEGGSNR
jgi:Skp family chaperone for outer membrane proteins